MSVRKLNPTRLAKLKESLEQALETLTEETEAKLKGITEILEKKKKLKETLQKGKDLEK